jgi:hypothetical protein
MRRKNNQEENEKKTRRNMFVMVGEKGNEENGRIL